MSGGVRSPSAAASQRRDPLGYGLVVGSYLLFGISATLVTWADAPESVLLVIRFALASAVLLLVFARRRPLRGVLQRGRWQRLLLMGALDAFTMLAYFFAVRSIGVAVATFFLFLQPVWVAFVAPHVLHVATERIVYFALAVAVGGMAVILWPSFTGGAMDLSVFGLLAALAAGWAYTFFQLHRQGADARGLERHAGHRGVPARRAVHPSAGALAVRRGGTRRSPAGTGSPA